MIQYGSDRVTELRFEQLTARVERRDAQWVDVEARFRSEAERLYPELERLSALIICTTGGQIAQIVPQDGGLDCEYQFTAGEKAQLEAYIMSTAMQARIAEAQ
ncbi:hypothetical protein IDH44_22310 [Paenibacillus sp. IB182496]|uniref:Uncharacterized protein n=1 Tax=Paenibacillus sabuli TaxID=2772509 RepID=A0A927GTS9_9BACL|nr:hypothetical protein [Paenibacillus sabuli]MBD2847938.1 hypothetical protein [Paenibacillus sabuli]